MNFTKLALYGFAAFGALKAYEASPIKFNLDRSRMGRRGSIQEALMWEQAGMPAMTRMMPRRK